MGSNYFNVPVTNNFSNSFFYSFNTPLGVLGNSDICLLVGLNLRLQIPILNSKIRQLSVKNNTPVYVLGYFSNFNYYVKHISNSTSTITQILEGAHWLSARISKSFSKTPLIVSQLGIFDTNTSLLENLFDYTSLITHN